MSAPVHEVGDIAILPRADERVVAGAASLRLECPRGITSGGLLPARKVLTAGGKAVF